MFLEHFYMVFNYRFLLSAFHCSHITGCIKLLTPAVVVRGGVARVAVILADMHTRHARAPRTKCKRIIYLPM